MYNSLIFKISYLLLALFVFGCGNQQQPERDTPTSGSARILADESFAPIVDAEIGTFQSLYNKASIQAEYLSESEAINKFLNRKTEIIVIGRQLREEEKKVYTDAKQTFSQLLFAYDAVTLVAHKNFPSDQITIEQLKDIFSGSVKNWNQIFPASVDSTINIVFDKSGSSNFRLLKDSLEMEAEKINAYAAGSNQKVIEYVEKTPGAVGIIGANWISDFDDPEVQQRLKAVKVLDIAVKNKEGKYESYNPFQSDLINGRYPLLRNIYFINSTSRTGLPTGLASFFMSDRGQRIVLKAGLMPAVVPGREINIRK